MTDKTLGKARGLNSIANPKDFKGSPGRRRGTPTPTPTSTPAPSRPAADPEPQREVAAPPAERVRTPSPPPTERAAPVEKAERAPTPHRAVTPGTNRKRRELSIPHQVAEALDRTGINPADVVMTGYRKHSDAIYAGAGGRMAARGRTRLRLSISDVEFEQLTRLGQARGWNRSETVGVILAMELLAAPEPEHTADSAS